MVFCSDHHVIICREFFLSHLFLVVVVAWKTSGKVEVNIALDLTQVANNWIYYTTTFSEPNYQLLLLLPLTEWSFVQKQYYQNTEDIAGASEVYHKPPFSQV